MGVSLPRCVVTPLILSGLLALLPTATHAQGSSPEIVVPRTATPPVLDGVLDDAAWRSAAVLDSWVQTKPGDNTPAVGTTEAFFSYDEEHLYIAIRATDQPGTIRYRRHPRDAISMQDQDWFSIRIDTYDDRRRAFGFALNALGYQGDGIQVEGVGFEDWDGIWYAEGRATPDGFTVEIAIPFKSLRYPDVAEQRWGLLMKRTYGRTAMEDSPWPLDRDLTCELCQMAVLTGIRDIATSRNIEISGTVLARAEQHRPDLAGSWDDLGGKADVGGNLKVGLAPNLTLDATMNPDFSQVESDAGQLEINNRFELFFREQRPFFLEATDIFQTRIGILGQLEDFNNSPTNIVYTRRVVDPTGGLKLSGKVGAYGLGVFAALDGAGLYDLDTPVGGVVPRDLDPYFGERSRFVIGRTKRDVLEDGYVGLVGTYRGFGGGYAYTVGGDYRLRFGRLWTIRGLYMHSASREPDVASALRETLEGRLSGEEQVAAAWDSLPVRAVALDGERLRGDVFQTQVELGSRHWQGGLAYVDITPAYQTEAGFTPRTDYAAFYSRVRYIYQGTGFFERIEPQIRYEHGFDHEVEGGLFAFETNTDRVMRVMLQTTMSGGNVITLGHSRKFLRVDDIDFPGLVSWWGWGQSQTIRWLSLGWRAEIERSVIFNDVVDRGPARPGSNVNFSLTAALRPVSSVRLDIETRAQRIWRRSETETRESKYAESVIPRFRLLVQLSKALGIRAITEYRFERFYDQSGELDSKRDQVLYDLLLTYLVQPQQSVHIGWTQLGEGDVTRPRRTIRRGGVVKVSYLWRF